ncbi:hypothetical protein M409DRAFT_28606 [Zasmidium cellare ATCC 36951]|uniref:2EXR domain-containing protein n=1 Tax=Zasmidium cellare ATCC 36951 TaxID=1080233 RepID=A0A6A6C3X8_ZASCE|nr:uncharacterized protein M409DRAFT_28606 [Zasmidium cellare ATCC 36951]KAF2160998.1 hypothetical protein M409DRAFT_28606 [Zasmidium cellare ATCC 36951]
MNNSLFGKLPAELRTSIYELALFSPNGIELGFIKAPIRGNWEEDSTLAIRPLNPHQLSPNLLSTCKQIHHEALPIVLSNHFTIPLNWNFLRHMALPAGRALADWGVRYTSHGHLITSLHITYSDLGMKELEGIAAFAKSSLHSLHSLQHSGLRPSLTLSIDLVHRAIGQHSPYIAHVDLGLKSASGNRHAIAHVIRDADAMASPWYRPRLAPGTYLLWQPGMEDALMRRTVREEAEYVESMVAYVQAGGVWAAEEEEYLHKYEYECGESDSEINETLWEADFEEGYSPKGGRSRGLRGSKKKAIKGRAKKW